MPWCIAITSTFNLLSHPSSLPYQSAVSSCAGHAYDWVVEPPATGPHACPRVPPGLPTPRPARQGKKSKTHTWDGMAWDAPRWTDGSHKLPGLAPTKHCASAECSRSLACLACPSGMCFGRPLFHIGDMLRDALKLCLSLIDLLLFSTGALRVSLASELGPRPSLIFRRRTSRSTGL